MVIARRLHIILLLQGQTINGHFIDIWSKSTANLWPKIELPYHGVILTKIRAQYYDLVNKSLIPPIESHLALNSWHFLRTIQPI